MRFTKQGVVIAFDSSILLFQEFLKFDPKVVLGNSFSNFTDYTAFYMRTFGVSEDAAIDLVYDDVAEAGEEYLVSLWGPRE